MRLLKLLLILFAFAAGPAVAGPFEDGLVAAQKGDYATALRLWRPLAEQGNARAQFKLGSMYDNGRGVQQDYAAAVSWYRKAAEQGNAFAQFNLGGMYFKGQGVPQDYVQAVSWYRKAAEQGDAEAQNNLGVMYDQGQGVPQDYAAAMSWYRKAAEQGNAEAQNNLRVGSVARSLLSGPLLNSILTPINISASNPAREVYKWGNDSVKFLEQVEKIFKDDPLNGISTSLNLAFSPPVLAAADLQLQILLRSHKELFEKKQYEQQEVWVHPCIVVSTISAAKSGSLKRKLNNSLAPDQMVAARQVWVFGLGDGALDRIERKDLTNKMSAVSGAQFGIMVSMRGMTTTTGDVVFTLATSDGGTSVFPPAKVKFLVTPGTVSNTKIQSTLESLRNMCPASW